MNDRLILNETELLLLQRQMEGDVSGLGYTLEEAGVETADYRGREGKIFFRRCLSRLQTKLAGFGK